jgi:hypothetical protein
MSHKFSILWPLLLFSISGSGTIQTTNEWQNKFGVPEAERFVMRDGITLTVFYSAEGQTCKAIIEAAKSQPTNVFEEILQEVIPLAGRGKRERTIGLGNLGGGISSTAYERVTITQTNSSEGNTTVVNSAIVSWNGTTCKDSKAIGGH